jgi:hypothetical protein
LDLTSKIKYYEFFSSYFFKKEIKDFNTIQTFFLLLKVKQINSRATLDSSFIKVSKEGTFLGSIFNFKLMDMAKLNASLNNQ